MLDPDLRRTLASAIDLLAETARDPWWIVSGAAVALHGVEPVDVGDVDLLLSVADARALLKRLAITPLLGSGTPRFRSAVFARWTAPPLVVEIMADFHVATADGWRAVRPQTRMAVAVDRRTAWVPDRAELADMLRLFGRPKDFARARLVELSSPA